MNRLKYVILNDVDDSSKEVSRNEAENIFNQLTNKDDLEFKDLEIDINEMQETSLFSGYIKNNPNKIHIIISPKN
jgi:hypothetical protein